MNGLSEYGTLVKITGEEMTTFSFSTMTNYRELRIYSGLAISRFRILSYTKNRPFYMANIEILLDEISVDKEKDLLKSISYNNCVLNYKIINSMQINIFI